jgi:hypothetical protein
LEVALECNINKIAKDTFVRARNTNAENYCCTCFN